MGRGGGEGREYGQKNSFFLVALNKRVSEGALLWAFLPDMAVLVVWGWLCALKDGFFPCWL